MSQIVFWWARGLSQTLGDRLTAAQSPVTDRESAMSCFVDLNMYLLGVIHKSCWPKFAFFFPYPHLVDIGNTTPPLMSTLTYMVICKSTPKISKVTKLLLDRILNEAYFMSTLTLYEPPTPLRWHSVNPYLLPLFCQRR